MAALVFAACSGSSPQGSPSGDASPGPSGSATPGSSAGPSATPSPAVGAIEHPTGERDVILRMESGGGFVPMEFSASQAPTFTLYGNGVVVFVPTVTTFPEPDANGVSRPVAWRTGTLDESQVQELLDFALTNGGLGTARAEYTAGGIADAPTTIFTVHAGGIDKTVAVNALAEESQPGPDSLARAAFWTLAQRLQDFDRGGSIPSDIYQPERFRGVLIEREAQLGIAITPWPWPSLTAADFTGGPPENPGFPRRVLSDADVTALGLANIEAGVQGLTLKAPDGKLYSFILRPLLVDEAG